MQRAEYGVAKKVLNVSCKSKNDNNHKIITAWLSDCGQNQSRMLLIAKAKLANNICPNRRPKNLLFVLSER